MTKKKSQYVKKPVLNSALRKDLSANEQVYIAAATWHKTLMDIFDVLGKPGKLPNKKLMTKIDTITAIANYFGVRQISVEEVLTEKINMGELSWDVFGLINYLTNEPKFGSMTFEEVLNIVEGALFVWAGKVHEEDFELLRKNYGINTDQKIETYNFVVQIADFFAFCKTLKINPKEIIFDDFPYLLVPANIKKRIERMGDKI